MSRQALIVVDMQNDYFPTGKWPLAGVEEAAGNVARLIEATRRSAKPVVFVRHESTRDDAPFFAPDTPGAQLHPTLLNRDEESVVLKHHINAFRDTELKTILDDKSIDELLIVGAMSHMCIDALARAAVDMGYKTTVIHDACASRDLVFNGLTIPASHVHGAFMAALEFGYARVLSTEEYLAESESSNL
ncbi:cysteine hydrolase family protein [Pseudomonas huanghezhanensis]|uniref:cysteine hydrolase family protein n=1 Tax=Pseudomonas huanghezhanensis TaxID=3002903 RepID=UPI00228576BD|nr:cysteine hydrolase family protein [Pseudomonas sp. BSw22131]